MNKKIKIAIADDHTLLRKGLIDLINSFGPFSVIIEAGDGHDILRQLENATSLPDICILDINMPELDGFGALVRIKAHWPEMKVLALSMYNNEFTIIRMLKAGANGYLLKNCDPAEFQKALIAIHERGFYDEGAIEKNILNKSLRDELISITPKELEFLQLCCSELAYKEIADRMHISPRTVEDYRDNLFRKLKVNTRTGLVLYAVNAGLLPPE